MKSLWMLIGIIIVSQGADALDYADVEGIIQDNCLGCHSEGAPAEFLPFETLENIKPNNKRMADALRDGRMPYGDPNFVDTEDGKKLLGWLENGTEFAAPPPVPPLILKDPRLLTFKDMEPILKRSCGGCHRVGGQAEKYEVLELSFLRKRAKKVWDTLDDLEMPLNNPDFIFTTDGRILMDWLRYGRDVTWRR